MTKARILAQKIKSNLDQISYLNRRELRNVTPKDVEDHDRKLGGKEEDLQQKTTDKVTKKEEVTSSSSKVNEDISEKKKGATFGRIVTDKEGKAYLLKKSSRFRAEKPRSKTPSIDTDLEKMAKRSFAEVGGARMFETIKYPNLKDSPLPKFYIVKSDFDKDDSKEPNFTIKREERLLRSTLPQK